MGRLSLKNVHREPNNLYCAPSPLQCLNNVGVDRARDRGGIEKTVFGLKTSLKEALQIPKRNAVSAATYVT
jgi:hypothetical protein